LNSGVVPSQTAQSQAVLDTAAPPASLCFHPPDEPAAVTVELKPMPFVIGRADSVDFQVPSNRVSREHAVFNWEAGQLWVRDLGSTNGTRVNGARIQRQALRHGDIITIADIELRLLLDGDAEVDPHQVVAQLRSWHELLLQGGAAVRFLPIWDMRNDVLFGCRPTTLAELPQATPPALAAAAVSDRRREQVHWLMMLRAAGLAAELPLEMPMLLEVPAAGDAELWAATLAGLARRPLMLQISTAAPPSLSRRIRNLGLQTAYIVAPGETPDADADYWLLSEEFTADIGGNENLWQPLSDLADAARGRNIELICNGVANEPAAHVCVELDVRLGMGPLFGEPCAACELPVAPPRGE
jgi:pSer/pThr/pTyr-binding forkhead associated (FHA) protein